MVLPGHGVELQVRLPKPGPRLKNRIPGVGQQHHVAGVAQGHAQMPHPLLGAMNSHHLCAAVDGGAIAAEVVLCHSLPQLWVVPQGIAVVLRLQRRLREHLHHLLRRMEVRRAHGKVEHLPPLLLICHHLAFNGGEDPLLKMIQPFCLYRHAFCLLYRHAGVQRSLEPRQDSVLFSGRFLRKVYPVFSGLSTAFNRIPLPPARGAPAQKRGPP